MTTDDEADRVADAIMARSMPTPRDQLRITIPGPPKSWERRTVGRDKRSRSTRQYAEAKERAAWAITKAVGSKCAWWQGQRLRLEVFAYFETNVRQDADNVLKLIGDAGNNIAWADDRWGTFRGRDAGQHVYSDLDRENPRVEVLVTALGDLNA